MDRAAHETKVTVKQQGGGELDPGEENGPAGRGTRMVLMIARGRESVLRELEREARIPPAGLGIGTQVEERHPFTEIGPKRITPGQSPQLEGTAAPVPISITACHPVSHL